MAYGGGLENRFRLFGERGFESHPLRQVGKRKVWLALCEGSPADFKRKLEFFIFARDSEQSKSGLPSFLPS